jgi:membrane-associated phospholipid phosphatase
LLIALILLIGFSRLWLGVHTPQDVVCGLTIGLTLIFIINGIINWAEVKPNRDLWLALLTNIFTIFGLIYIRYFSAYPMDYIEGKLLVDPMKSVYVTIVIYGYLLGILNGCFLCRRFFPFNPKDVSVKCRAVRGLVGGIFIVLLLKYVIAYIIMNSVQLRFAVPTMLFIGLFITLFYPMIFQYFDKKLKE